MRPLAVLAWVIAIVFAVLCILVTVLVARPLKYLARWFSALGDKLSKSL